MRTSIALCESPWLTPDPRAAYNVIAAATTLVTAASFAKLRSRRLNSLLTPRRLQHTCIGASQVML